MADESRHKMKDGGAAFDWRFSIKGCPRNRIKTEDDNDKRYYLGYVLTANGIVGVYSQGRYGGNPYTRLDLAVDGFVYVKTYQKHYSKRYLVTLAVRFADAMLKAREANDE